MKINYELPWVIVRAATAFAKITEELRREYNMRPPFHSGHKILYEMPVLIICLFLMSHSFALKLMNDSHV